MALNIPIPGKLFRLHAFCVPLEENRTRMIIVGARDFATSALLDPVFNRQYRRILDEDEAVVCSSRPPEVPPASEEHSVATDRGTLRFRRYYYDQLRRPGGPAPDASAEKQPPLRPCADGAALPT